VTQANQDEALQVLTEPADQVMNPGTAPLGQDILLPFERMGEYDFERLCARLASRQTDVQGARRYGTSGQAQFGIDVYARWRNKPGYCVYQCKRYQEITNTTLKAIITKFIEDCKKDTAPEWLEQATGFVLCVTQPLEKTQFTDVVEKTYQGLGAKLALDVWDTVKLTDLLKSEPEIVEEFFGREAAQRLCNVTPLLSIPMARYIKNSGASDSQLLEARFRTIPFEGRKQTQDMLEAWATTGLLNRSHLIIGDGGTGKTRLALEMALQYHAQGWVAGFIRRDHTGIHDVVTWEKLLRRDQPTLLIADYAETLSRNLPNTPLAPLRALRDAMKNTSGSRTQPVRLLLLSRDGGTWFETLCNESDFVQAEEKSPLPTPSTLQGIDLTTQQHERGLEFARARNRFAEQVGVTPLSLDIPDLTNPDFVRILFVHMLALIACHEPIMDHPNGEKVLDKMLARESEKFWEPLLGSKASPVRLAGVQRVLTLITLGKRCQNTSELEELTTLENALSDLSDPERTELAEGLQRTYPDSRRQPPQPMAPDLLAEHLIYKSFFQTTGISEPKADWVFKAAFHPAVDIEVEAIPGLGEGVPHLIRLTQRNITGLNLLERLLGANRLLYAQVLFNQIPTITTAMRKLAAQCGETVVTTMQVLAGERSELKPELARVLHNQSNRQSAVGDRAGALKTINEAMQHYRELVSKNRDAFLPDLALSLNNQSIFQHAVGDRAVALETIKEAVQIRRELVPKNHDAFLPNLAQSLNNQSNFQRAVGDQTGALETISEAVQFYRELVAKNRDAFLPDLAGGLNNQSNCRSEVGDRTGALETISEAVQIRRELVSKNHDAFLPELAQSLHNQSLHQSAVGNQTGALKSASESVTFYRELDSRTPGVFALEHAIAAKGLSDQMASDRATEAAKLAEEAVQVLKPVFIAYPDAVADQMQLLLEDYVTRCEVVGIEPDVTLLDGLQWIGESDSDATRLQELLEKFDPLLQAVAAVALGNDEPRAELEEILVTLEEDGWRISDAVRRIWTSERNLHSLTGGLDDQDSALVHRILEIIAEARA
jgi:hypothetical protein